MARFNSSQRAQILEAAIGVFARRGLKGAAIRLVGQAAGVNSALIYYYFENKDTLFVEAIRHVIRGLFEFLQAHKTTFVDGQQRLSFLVDGVLDYFNAHPERMHLLAVTICLHTELLAKVIQGLIQDQVLLPIEVLKEGMDRGELCQSHPVQTWWNILGMCFFTMQMRDAASHMTVPALALPPVTIDYGRTQIKALLYQGLIPSSLKKKAKP